MVTCLGLSSRTMRWCDLAVIEGSIFMARQRDDVRRTESGAEKMPSAQVRLQQLTEIGVV